MSAANEAPLVSISVVSHGQGEMVRSLLADIYRLILDPVEIILTINIPESDIVVPVRDNHKLVVIKNAKVKGFGENHNAAFLRSTGSIFLVSNPDIRLHEFELSVLIAPLKQGDCVVIAPLVLSPLLCREDSARRFPTFARLLTRLWFRFFGGAVQQDYPFIDKLLFVDWVAGMFVAFDRHAYQRVNGFDEGYFMYLEDVDICWRIRLSGLKVGLNPETFVIHDARRASRRQLTHLIWHLQSMIRFFSKKMRLLP